MATVYILFSKDADKFYVGSCLNLEERLIQHKNKLFESAFTAKYCDWSLFFSLADLEYKQARAIENHIKKMKSRTFISNLKKHPEIGNRLIEKYKGAGSSR